MTGTRAGRRALLAGLAAGAVAPARATLPPSVSVLTWSTFSLSSIRAAFARHLHATGTPVRHTHLPWASYLDVLPDALGWPQGPDVVWLSDSWLPDLAQAGLVAPLDRSPAIAESVRDLEPSCRAGLTFGGRVYGLPYYRDALTLFCNMEMLAEAGFTAPPTRWEELVEQARALQSRGISAYPFVMPLANEPWLLELVTALAYSFGGGFIGQGGQPVMTRGTAGIVPALTFLHALLHELRLLPLGALRLTEAGCAERLGRGQHAFALLPSHRADWLHHTVNAPAANAIRPALMPMGGAVTSSVTCGWLRLQSISAVAMANSGRAERALALLNALGGRDARGEHATARDLFMEHGLAYCAMPLHEDPAIHSHLEEDRRLRLVTEDLLATARPKDTIAPGAVLWQSMTSPLWRRVASGALAPAEAAAAAEAAWIASCRHCEERR